MNDGELSGLLERTCDLHQVPGMAAAVVSAGGITACAAAGGADMATGLRAHVDLPSRWYSISKALTAIAVVELVQQGRLDLDAPLTAVLPALRFSAPDATAHASLRDCLLHRTGLTGGNSIWDGGPADPNQLVALIPELPCAFRTGDGFHYQNLHYTIIERAMAAVGADWHQAMHALAQRLGGSFVTDQTAFMSAARFAPHGPNGLTVPQPCADVEIRGIIAGGGVCGTIQALATVAGMAAGNGTWQGREIISRGWWDLLVSPVLRGDDSGPGPERRNRRTAIAGGWSSYRGHRLLAWAGGHRGYFSYLAAIPELGLAACAMGNRSGSPAGEAVCLELLDRAAGWPAVDWPARFHADKLSMLHLGTGRLAPRLAEPRAGVGDGAACTGTFHHPAFGDLAIVSAGTELWLRFRAIELQLLARDQSRWSAVGSDHGQEIVWELRCDSTTVSAPVWWFNPDHNDYPVAFRPTTKT